MESMLSLCVISWCQIEFGIVYSCIEDKMYTARKGKGAFCNGVPIKVSGQEGYLMHVWNYFRQWRCSSNYIHQVDSSAMDLEKWFHRAVSSNNVFTGCIRSVGWPLGYLVILFSHLHAQTSPSPWCWQRWASRRIPSTLKQWWTTWRPSSPSLSMGETTHTDMLSLSFSLVYLGKSLGNCIDIHSFPSS